MMKQQEAQGQGSIQDQDRMATSTIILPWVAPCLSCGGASCVEIEVIIGEGGTLEQHEE